MYKHAHGGGHRSDMTRAEWRIFRYAAIKAIAKRSAAGAVDGPSWLQEEVRKFTPAKWISCFDKKTGRKKEPALLPEPSYTKRKMRAMSGKNLFARSNREGGRGRKKPKNSN